MKQHVVRGYFGIVLIDLIRFNISYKFHIYSYNNDYESEYQMSGGKWEKFGQYSKASLELQDLEFKEAN